MAQSSSYSRRLTLFVSAVAAILALVIIGIVIIPRLLTRPSTATTTADTTICPTTNVARLPQDSGNFKTGFIYQVMLDRFFNGDPTNDNPPGDQGLNDPTHQNWKLYWGGDLKGLTEKIPYIAGMGASAIWISPPVENVTKPLDFGDGNGPQAGYHGYWAQDDYQIDPHLGTWADFDTLVATAHQAGLKIMVDFAANHSNPSDLGQFGAIYKNGVQLAAYNNDPNNWFHHAPSITNFNDKYDLEYQSLEGLADFAQENPAVDAYLKGAIAQFMAHGVDGIRFDAVKHMPGPTGGWLRTVADGIEATGSHYLVGEWQTTDPTDLTYPAAVRFANNSGISLLNFPIYNAIDDAYARGNLIGPVEINSVLQQEEQDFTWMNDQANFIDNHDVARFLTAHNDKNALHAALAVVMTIPGIPIVYYGTEQYLHNDTQGGGDPYNRPMMTSFDTTTPAYQLLHCLGTLRDTNPALPYGNYTLLHVNRSQYVYQRQFGQSVVVVAVNSSASAVTVPAEQSALPAGSYKDYLSGKFHGGTLTVGNGGAIASFSLPANAIAIWQYQAPAPTSPLIGNIGTTLTHPGDTLVVDGQGFASDATLMIGKHAATITASTAQSITATVPTMPGGQVEVTVCQASQCSPGYPLVVASAPQVPMTITVNGLPALTPEEQVYMTGAVAELGGGSTAPTSAIGPMITSGQASNSSRFLLVSLPACQTLSFSFEIVHLGGAIDVEGTTHTLTTPCSGETTATYNWGVPK